LLSAAQRRQFAFALVAALAFMLQAIGNAWADRTVPLLDAFGNPLCIGNEVPFGEQHKGDHGNQSDCCAIACSGWAASALDPKSASDIIGHFRAISEPLRGEIGGRPELPVRNKQANPRAPPILI